VTVISTCNAATLTWGGNCSGTTPGNISVGASSGTINNTVANYVGSATATCGANGTWGAASGTCTQSVVTGIWWFWVHSLHGTGGHYSLEVGNVHNCVNGQYGTTIPSSCGQLPSCSTFTYDPTGTPCSYSGGSGGVTGVLTIPSSTCLSTLTACP